MSPVPKPGKAYVNARDLQQNQGRCAPDDNYGSPAFALNRHAPPDKHSGGTAARPRAQAVYPGPGNSVHRGIWKAAENFLFVGFFLRMRSPSARSLKISREIIQAPSVFRSAQTLTTQEELKGEHRRRTKRNCRLEKWNCARPSGGDCRHGRFAIETVFRRVGRQRVRAGLRINALGRIYSRGSRNFGNPEALLDPQPRRWDMSEGASAREIETRKLIAE
jgi:hypothetical protein